MHVDEFIDELLHSERVCDIILPRLQVWGQGDLFPTTWTSTYWNTEALRVVLKSPYAKIYRG